MKTLLDLRGLVLASMWGGTDPDAVRGEDGKRYNSPGHTLENFVEKHLLPAFEHSRMRDVICVLDAGNQWRRQIFPGYKIKPEMPQAQLDAQNAAQAAVFDLIKGLGLTMVSCPETEADDVIAFLAEKIPGPKIVRTVDHDLLQLADEQCLLFVPHDLKSCYEPPEVDRPIAPRHVALFKSLCGDSSDKYLGVRGFGKKAWNAIVSEYGEDGLDELVDWVSHETFSPLAHALQQAPDKALQKIYEGRIEWTIGWRLACLHPEIVEARRGNRFYRLQWEKRIPDPDRVRRVLNAEGARRIIPLLEPFLPQQWILDADSIGDPDEYLRELAPHFTASAYVAFDLETTDELQHEDFRKAANGREYVDMYSSTITGAGFTFGRNNEYTFYSSYGHADTNNLPREFLLKLLQAIPSDKPIVVHNGLFEVTVVKNNTGYEILNVHDTRLMASHVDEEVRHNLKELSKSRLNYDQIKYRDVIEEGKTMADYSAVHVAQYGADDPLVTAHLYDLFKLIMEIEGTWEFCRDQYFPNIYPVSDAYLAGVSLDVDELARQHDEDQATYERRCTEIRQLIKTHQTPESTAEGVDRVTDERLSEALPKFMKKLTELPEEQSKKLLATKLKDAEKLGYQLPDGARPESWVVDVLVRHAVKQAVAYQDFETRQREVEVKPTLVEINRVLSRAGWPELASTTANALTSYLTENGTALEPHPDVSRLFAALDGVKELFTAKDIPIKRRSGPAYEHFIKVLSELKMRGMDPSTLVEKVGFEMNFDSPPQMQVLLYGMLNLPIRMRALKQSQTRIDLDVEDAAAQANKDAIAAALANDCPEGSWQRDAVIALREARECLTRLKMFYRTYPLWVHPKDGNIHPQITLCGTETRRPTGSSPNPLQWPKRGDGKKFRKSILPNRNLGHDLVVSIDFDSQELRFGAGLSRDDNMLQAFIGRDEAQAMTPEVAALLDPDQLDRYMRQETRGMHSTTGAGMMGLSYEEFEQARHDEDHPLYAAVNAKRTDAKPVNFGALYEVGPPKLSRQLLVPEETAREYLQIRRETYPGYVHWSEDTKEEAAQFGYVSTLFGDRRHLHRSILDPEWCSRAGRQAINFRIQGLAAGKLAFTLSEIHRQGTFRRHGAVLIAPIYDELVFSCHHSVVIPLILEVHRIMTMSIPGMPVPVVACPSLGVNFANQIEIGKFPTPESIQAAVDKALGTAVQAAPAEPEYRFLLWHPESSSCFEVFSDKEYTEALSAGCDDVTGVESWEVYFRAVEEWKANQQEAA